MSLLSAHQVSFYWPQASAPALSGLNLELEAGHILALCGESGSGKTTALRLLAGLLEPSQGEIRLEGERVWGPAFQLVPGHKAIRLLDQRSSLEESLSLRDNLQAALRDFTPEWRQERSEEVLALTGLSTLADKRPRQLSGGERQRAAWACAIATEPSVLLLDEPFSAVDTFRRSELRTWLKAIVAETGLGVVLVSHDPADAWELADNLFLLKAGQVEQQGPPQTLFDQPRNSYVARFFGEVNEEPDGHLWRPWQIGQLPAGEWTLRACQPLGRDYRWEVYQEGLGLRILYQDQAEKPGFRFHSPR